MNGEAVNIKNWLADYVLKNAGPINSVIDQIVLEALIEDLAECMPVAERAYRTLLHRDPKNRAFITIWLNIEAAKDEGITIKEKHQHLQTALVQANMWLFELANREDDDCKIPVCLKNLTEALTGVFEEGRQE